MLPSEFAAIGCLLKDVSGAAQVGTSSFALRARSSAVPAHAEEVARLGPQLGPMGLGSFVACLIGKLCQCGIPRRRGVNLWLGESSAGRVVLASTVSGRFSARDTGFGWSTKSAARRARSPVQVVNRVLHLPARGFGPADPRVTRVRAIPPPRGHGSPTAV